MIRFTPWPFYPGYPLNRRLGGPQSGPVWTFRRYHLVLSAIESQFLGRQARSPNITPTELSRFPSVTVINGILNIPINFYVYGSMHRCSILITVERDPTKSSLFIILRVHSTCFGCQPHPSSGVHETVTTASGTGLAVLCSYLPPTWPLANGHVGGR